MVVTLVWVKVEVGKVDGKVFCLILVDPLKGFAFLCGMLLRLEGMKLLLLYSYSILPMFCKGEFP